MPCDQAGEDCPLQAAKASRHKERVLHIHQTPRGQEHVDVEMLPIYDDEDNLTFFVELLKPVPLASGDSSSVEMVGESKAFNRMLEKVARVGATNASVLLLAESGTGKEQAARAIHMASTRKSKPMVTLECAGLTDSLFESELFGHVKGAFTGAHSNKKGLVAHAEGGTLFLDEVGDIPLAMQVKLLRLIESGTYRSVGSAEVMTANFRLICATHMNIAAMVDEGRFRQDLYYRINVFPIELPSLHERRADIALLAKTLLKNLSPSTEYYLTGNAVKLLQQWTYKGNVRELRNLLSRALVLTDTNVLDDKVMQACIEADPEYRERTSRLNEEPKVNLRTAEHRYLKTLIESCDGNKQEAAAIAGISLRSLYRKLESYP